jgi:large-conductance mechanosensitive channel
MFKISVKFLIAIGLSILLTNSSSIAFHKENSKITQINTEWDGDPKTKKEFENKVKREWCALKTKAIIIKGKPKIDPNTGIPIQDEDQKKIFGEDVFKIQLEGYHLNEAIKTNGKLQPTLANLNFGADWDNLKLIDLFKMYCLQDKTKERPSKFKGSYLEELYAQIAADNGFFKKENEEGDYNQKVLEGPLLDDIFKPENGIKIKDPNVVWYVPDFLIDTYKKNKEDEAEQLKIKKVEEEERKKKQARNEAIKKGKEKWILENKQNYLDLFIDKNSEHIKLIRTLEDLRKKLNDQLRDYENFTEESKEEIEIAFDDLANIDQKIKDKKREIRDNKKKYLSKTDLESFEDRLKKINSINFEKYDNYLRLKIILKKAKKSKSPVDFLGKEGWKIQLPKSAGGKTIKFGSDKIGFIEEFANIKKKSLGSGYKTDLKNIAELSEEIIEKENDISEFIVKPVKELVDYDNLLEEEKAKTQWGTYALYLLIFLIIIAAIFGLIFYLKKTKEDLKEEAEKKVGYLKSEFDNKLRNTSDQIKLSNRDSIRSQQSSIESNQPKTVQEKPKTPEQIITEKYDQLVSDYKDALDDFSKVAGFKEKWQGLALSRKERQDGTKTILINSTRAFEKAEIWCVTFSDKYFAFPGSSVKFNMATYMNLDFEKAGRDFKGVFSVSTGSNYSAEPSVLRRGGAGFVVERTGKIIFPN